MDALEVLAELQALGYEANVRTAERAARVSGHEYRYTVAQALTLRGPAEPPEHLRRSATEHRRELMALVSLERPPVAWLGSLLRRYREDEVDRRRGAGGGVTAGVVAANLAAFVELSPREDGPLLRPLVGRKLEASPHPPRAPSNGPVARPAARRSSLTRPVDGEGQRTPAPDKRQTSGGGTRR